MSKAYENAKRIALGLNAEEAVFSGDDLWNVSLDNGTSGGELLFQYFEKGFPMPDELLRQKTALMLYGDEYTADAKAAEALLFRLNEALNNGDFEALLSAHPLADWLSLVFLKKEEVQTLEQVLGRVSAEEKKRFAESLKRQKARLKKFDELFDYLLTKC